MSNCLRCKRTDNILYNKDDKSRRKPFGNERFPLAFCFYILYTLSVHKNKEVNVREHTKV